MIATFIFLIKKHCNKETPSQANKSLFFGSIINVGVAIIPTFIFLEKIIKKESKNEGNPLE